MKKISMIIATAAFMTGVALAIPQISGCVANDGASVTESSVSAPDNTNSRNTPSVTTGTAGSLESTDTTEPITIQTSEESTEPTETKQTEPVEQETESKPAVTIITTTKQKTDDTKPTPVETEEKPQVTTTTPQTTTTTKKPAEQSEPVEIKLDENGFPENPTGGQKFTDENGQKWEYDHLMEDWFKDEGPTVVEDFPDNYEGGIFGGEQILH